MGDSARSSLATCIPQLVRSVAAGLALALCVPTAAQASREDEHRAWEKQYDLKGIARSEAVESVVAESVLRPPTAMPEDAGDFKVASVPPRIDFGIVQGLRPFYLPEAHPLDDDAGNWADWGPVSKDDKGRFYFTLGNHRARGGDAAVVRYDPATRSHEVLFQLRDVIDWKEDDYADGKLHGFPDVSQDGELWLLTFFGPDPADEDWGETYHGGRLVVHAVDSGETHDLGIPLEGDSWPYHALDRERGVLFGIGQRHGWALAYDTDRRGTIHAGALPEGMRWFNRVTLLDRATGNFYGTETLHPHHPAYRREASEHPHVFLRYRPEENRFETMEARTPVNPATGLAGPVRAHTLDRDKDGAFWCLDYYGTLFRFFPDEDRVSKAKGFHWGTEGAYTTSLVMSPDGRFLYYVPGAQSGHRYGLPVVQYNIETGVRKVLAFLGEFIRENYGYAATGTYGLEVDDAGESLFFYVNGAFAPREKPGGRERIAHRRPAFFHLWIPEEER